MRIRILSPDMAASKFQHNLARLRKHLGLSQFDAAKLAGCSKTTIQSVELTRLALSPTLAATLEGALGVPADWLLKNDLSSSIPESVYVGQESQLSDEDTIETKELLGLAFKVLDQLPSRKALSLYKHFANQFIQAVQHNFGRHHPGMPRAESLDHIIESVAAAKRQKAKRLRPKGRSRTRQSV